MSEEQAFGDAIIANPEDDTARLVFADWLEEHGRGDEARALREAVRDREIERRLRAEIQEEFRRELRLIEEREEWRNHVRNDELSQLQRLYHKQILLAFVMATATVVFYIMGGFWK